MAIEMVLVDLSIRLRSTDKYDQSTFFIEVQFSDNLLLDIGIWIGGE